MKGPRPLPLLRVLADGTVAAGEYVLEPSHKKWRRKRAWWRVRVAGAAPGPWRLTPRLALAAAAAPSAVPKG